MTAYPKQNKALSDDNHEKKAAFSTCVVMIYDW